MASKRSGYRVRVWLPRYGLLKDNKRVRRERELAHEAKPWNENRIRRFEAVQQRQREWIKFSEIAEEYSEQDGPVGPKKVAARRERAYALLEHDLLLGNFEEKKGRSQVLFLFPGVSNRRMTRQWLQDAIDNNYDDRCGRSYLENCWIRRNHYERWREWHHLPKLPPRFQPQKSQNVSRAKSGGEAAALKALATARDEAAAVTAPATARDEAAA